MKHFGDITKISGYTVPVVDVITGGSPCQDLSVAGKRAGLAGERSGLFMEQMRIVKEMRERDRRTGRAAWAIRPRFMVWENVDGARSSPGGDRKGEDFAAVIEEIIKVAEPNACVYVRVPDGGWTKSGCYYAEDGSWSIAWRVHDAQFWGVPQRRKRISLVADFGGLSAPEILFERKGLSGDPEPCGEARQETAGSAEECPGTPGVLCLNDQGGERMDVSEDVAGTLRAQDHGHPPAILAAGFCTEHSARARPIGYEEETSPTLRAGTVPAAVYENHGQDTRFKGPVDTAPTIVSSYGTGGNDQQAVMVSAIVRRLTPLECERLQGFPDGWTDIGEWTDSKGKRHKEADSPRYKALGNSIALPFWEYLARRICAQYERPVTMASLFDGIGGFPLAFERTGAKAVWASEIEEFPIAVTKIRFPEKETDE